MKNLTGKESEDKKHLIISRTLEADLPAHSIVALDSSRGKYRDYRERSYLAPIDPKTGAFSLKVTQPHQSGTIFLSFCFKNGVNPSDGKQSFQQNSTVSLSYSTTDGKRSFTKE